MALSHSFPLLPFIYILIKSITKKSSETLEKTMIPKPKTQSTFMKFFNNVTSQIKFYIQRIYRLSFKFNKQDNVVWKDLKKMHLRSKWDSGIYEKDRFIETIFSISETEHRKFYYMITEGFYHCKVNILNTFPVDLTTDVFVLATHFNNLLNNGVVVVNPNNQSVEFYMKREILIPFLYSGELYDYLIRHHSTSKDIYKAFERLVNEQEAPAIIIADLLNESKNNDNKSN
jgi:hypothetical protein